MTGWVLLTGVGTGLGLWLLLAGIYPPPVRLEHLLDPVPPVDTSPAPADAHAPGILARWGQPGAGALARLGLPSASTRALLRTLDRSPQAYLAEQAATALLGALLPLVATGLLLAAGISLDVTWPMAGCLLAGAAGFLTPRLALRAQAHAYRADFRDALSSFLDLVVISLASGAGIDQALDDAAAVGTGAAYTEIRYALAEAHLARVPVWQSLASLGQRLGVAEVQQLASAVGLSETEGARVRLSLRARAVALRARQLTDAEGQAHAATERMAVPVVLLFTGFLLFLGYPAVQTVLGGL